MSNVTFEDFISLVKLYNKDEVDKVTRAYELSKNLHAGQKRDSGEDYIIHPLKATLKLHVLLRLNHLLIYYIKSNPLKDEN